MKIKQMAEEIKKQMPENLDEVETLRYIYIYLGKQKSFDPQYYYGNEEVKKKIYRISTKNLNNEEFLTGNKKLICTSISSALRKLAKEFEINVETLQDSDENGLHMFNIAKLQDGRILHLDLQQDLTSIHSGQETHNFGDLWDFYDTVDMDTIRQIDEKIGYKRKNKGYKRDEIKLIGEGLKGKPELDKVKALFNSEEFNEVLRETEGYIELENFVEDSLVSVGAYNSDVITCYRDKNIQNEPLPEKQFSMCVLAREIHSKGQYFQIYMFKQKEKKFVEVSVERMKRLKHQGLKIRRTNSNAYVENLLGKIIDDDMEK